LLGEGIERPAPQSIAHNAFGKKAHKARYGYEKKLLDATIPIFENLALAVTGTDQDLESFAASWARKADEFWQFVMLQAVEEKMRRKRKTGVG
jgi:hypothetical protein